jgi:hypothetical protein
MASLIQRRWLAAAPLVVGTMVLCPLPAAWGAAPGQPAPQYPAPIERRPPPANSASPAGTGQRTPNAAERRGINGEHLAQWMDQHRSLTPQQQQQALQNESGFRQLPPQTQQRMLDRLAQLDAMTPVERQRRLAHIEAMEKLSPNQRAEVRSAMSQLGGLPQDQRRVVARTFRALRELPPEQRIQAYASGRYGPPLSEAQRSVLMDLLKVEPMLPPPGPQASPQTPPAANAFR